MLGFDPVETVTVPAGFGGDPVAAWQARVDALPRLAAGDGDLPFCGGWVGHISYECNCGTDRVWRAAGSARLLPDLRFGLYDAIALFDHAAGQWLAAGIDWSGDRSIDRPALRDRMQRVQAFVSDCRPPDAIVVDDACCAVPVANMSHDDYLANVRRIQEYIAAGDVYQVNLTQRFAARTSVSPVALYRRLCRVNPAPRAALLAWPDYAVLSASPELFLDLRDRQVVTRPIKGTRPRIGDPVVDASRQAELARSEKDRAELTMIVDLLRNDLGRVCRFGSVRVVDAGAMESHPTVYHRVATVTGELADGRSWLDLLRATFPGGSITGAPKIRAMEIIDELEPTPRDVYCGSIGWVGLDGSLSLNIAIRTMVMRDADVFLYAGGGIVADSNPQDEYDESLAKAAGMMRALGHEVLGEPRVAPERAGS
jgi:aminodeoxychorismate synthase component I